MFVNTGRTLVLPDRNAASRFFRSPAMKAQVTATECNDDEKRACVPAKGGRLFCTDRCWALRANAAGYDTVQILMGPDYMPELIVATRVCLSQPQPIGTCPPAGLQLRTGEAATRSCNCSEASPVLNCYNTPVE